MGNITLKQVSKSFGSTVIIPKLDLVIEDGEFVVFVGPSGCGKSTLMNMVAGIMQPTEGTILHDGRPVQGINQRVGYMTQADAVLPWRTARQNVELPLLLHKLSRKARHEKVSLALDLVGLADRHDHFPRQLSGGQEQRVAIARAIVTDPKIIVADEPTGDLDAAAAASVMALLKRLHEELGKTLIMVTHDPKTAAYADQTLHLEKGRLVEASAPPAAQETSTAGGGA